MKKALVVLIGVLMAVMFAAESYAAVEVGGTIDVRGRWRDNNNDLNKDYYGSTAFWNQKVNLWVDAKVAEGLKGYIELQTAGNTSQNEWISSWGSRSAIGGTTAVAVPNSFLNENTSLGYMQIRYAYIDFMIPSTPVGIKIGHMPVLLGHSIWANTGIWGSDGLLIYAVPVKELMIALGTVKGYDTVSNTNRSDADLYVLLANYTFIPKNTVGFNASYIHRSGAADGNPLANIYWSGQSAGGAAFNDINDVRFWNIMLTVDGALDFGLGYKFEVDKQFGYLDKKGPNSAVTELDLKGSGLAFLVGSNYKIADIAKVGLDVGYGSGDKCDTWSSTTDGAACSSSGDKFEGYINMSAHHPESQWMIYDLIVGQKKAANTFAGTYAGIYNTIYAKLGTGVTPMKDMSIDLNIFYLRAVKERYYGQKKNIGYEADLTLNYKIYKNLNWMFQVGYLLAGDHYKAINANDRIDDGSTYAFEQKLSLKF